MTSDVQPSGSNVTELVGSDVAIRSLHHAIEELAARAATAYAVQAPIRVEDRGGFPCHIWYESRELSIVSLDGTVGLEPGPRFDYHPDTTFLCGREQARTVAQALISASAYVATHPPSDE